MGDVALGVNDRTIAGLDNTIARAEPSRRRGLNEIDMRPLIAMVVNVVSNLAKQNSVMLEHPICFVDKRWV